ncbi:hypothetical protein [Streptomyces sp. HYC2]|nr:hypothetical protein [Streptomyces sp. HYC2]
MLAYCTGGLVLDAPALGDWTFKANAWPAARLSRSSCVQRALPL